MPVGSVVSVHKNPLEVGIEASQGLHQKLDLAEVSGATGSPRLQALVVCTQQLGVPVLVLPAHHIACPGECADHTGMTVWRKE